MNIAENISRLQEHTTYTHTFLHWVIIQIRYSCVKGDHYESYKRFFDKFHGLDFTQSKYEAMKTVPVRIKAGNGGSSLKLDDSFIQVRIHGPFYKNFEKSLMPFLNAISALMCDLKASVSKIELRKINLWGYHDDNNITQKLMKMVLSADLNAAWSPIEKEVEEDEEIQLTRLFGEELLSGHTSTYVLAFGYIKPMNDPNKMSRIILDMQGEVESELQPSQIIPMFKELNGRIYDMFHWSISKQSIDILQHE